MEARHKNKELLQYYLNFSVLKSETCQKKREENVTDMGEKQSIEMISEESLMLDLANKDFKADTKIC